MIIKEFEELIPQIANRSKNLFNNLTIIPELLDSAQKNTFYNRYGIGGEGVHRGAMCPDAFIEMDSNFTRGKIVEEHPSRRRYFRYAFDKNDQLLYVEREDDIPTVEVIFRESDIIWGLKINKKDIDTTAQAHTIYGNILNGKNIVANFATFYRHNYIFASLMHYQDNVPFKYVKNGRWEYEIDPMGIHINSTLITREIEELVLNETGDVTQVRWLKNEDDSNPVWTRTLTKPVPRKRWDNLYGLVTQ